MRTMNKIKFLRSKLKIFSDIYNGNSIPDDKKDSFVNKKIPYIATKNIDADTHQIDYENGLSVNEDDGFRIAKTKSSLLCIEGGSAGKKLGYLNQEVAFVNKLCCFTPKNIDSKFLFYSLQSSDFLSEFSLHLTGMIGGVKIGEIKNLYISYPDDLGEQHKIACFLDRKIGQIDNLISNQEKQIEKLKEYRQAIITKAVTKGLNPNVSMKDSGIEWIGKIKQDYHCEKLKFLLSSPMLYGANESGGKQEKGCTRFIRITDIDSNGNLKDTNDNQYLSASKSTGYILKNKDILFARSGGTVGKSFLYKNPGFPCSFAGYLIKAECEETLLLSEFLYYYTKSSLYEIWKNMIFVQSTIQNIGAQRYGNLDIVIPSIAEQKQIVQYIDKKCMLINKLIDIKNRTRKQLLDFKQSLIYEYVTGKKRVSL